MVTRGWGMKQQGPTLYRGGLVNVRCLSFSRFATPIRINSIVAFRSAKDFFLPSRTQTTRLREERIFRGAKGDTDPLSHGFLGDMHRNCIVVVVSRYNACTFAGSNLNSTSGD
jgi:hypothetical protein